MTPRPALHLPLNGSLAGTAANVAVTATGNGALRYRSADLGGRQCALVEEAGANFVTNPSFETGTTGWSVFSGRTMSQQSTHALEGTYGAQVVNDSTATTGAFGALAMVTSVPSAGTYTLSMNLFLPTGFSVFSSQLQMLNFTAGSFPSDVMVNRALTNQWQRVSGQGTIDAGDLSGLIQCTITNWPQGGGANTLFADGIQLEAGDHVTTYIDGSLGTGYAWSGTPHASTSTRALTTIEADYPSTIEHIFCRYSEDFGETWATASLTSATTFGSYASFDLTDNVLTIESSRAVMVRDVAVYDVPLLPVHQEQIIAAIEAGTFGAGRKPLFVPRGYPAVMVKIRK